MIMGSDLDGSFGDAFADGEILITRINIHAECIRSFLRRSICIFTGKYEASLWYDRDVVIS